MATATSKTQDVSNCLMVPFQDVNGSSPGSWSLCYNQSQNTLSLAADVNPPGSGPLVSTIDADGLKDIIEFLYQVNMWMQQASNKNSGNG